MKKKIIKRKGGSRIGRKIGLSGSPKATDIAEATIQELKGNRNSAERLWDGNEKVRAAAGKAGGANILEGDSVSKKLQKSPQAKKVRKGEGKAAADPQQPSGGSLGKTADMADAGIPKYMIDAYKAKGYDKGLKAKIEELTRAKLARKKATENKDVIARAKSQQKYGPDFNKTYLLNSIQDMIERGGPGGKSKTNFKRQGIKRKAGGVVKKRGGGMTRQGLSPAEEARSGTMSQAKRKKYMNKGGLVKRKLSGSLKTRKAKRKISMKSGGSLIQSLYPGFK